MKGSGVDRRKFIASLAGSGAVVSGLRERDFSFPAAQSSPASQSSPSQPKTEERKVPPRIKFAVIGINHYHINSQIEAAQRGGGEVVRFYAKEPDLVVDFTKRYPQVELARSENEILEDSTIQLVLR